MIHVCLGPSEHLLILHSAHPFIKHSTIFWRKGMPTHYPSGGVLAYSLYLFMIPWNLSDAYQLPCNFVSSANIALGSWSISVKIGPWGIQYIKLHVDQNSKLLDEVKWKPGSLEVLTWLFSRVLLWAVMPSDFCRFSIAISIYWSKCKVSDETS